VSGSGTVTGPGINCPGNCSEIYPPGTVLTLTATPTAGATFAGWSGACAGMGTCTVTIISAKSVTATFVGGPTVSLSVIRTGTGNGTVTSDPVGITCGADCTESYRSLTPVTLKAAASTGSVFSGWSGGGCFATGSCTTLLSANTVVFATFDVQTFTLTVEKPGAGGSVWSVASTPGGLTCTPGQTSCSASFAGGTPVTLTATPILDIYRNLFPFMGWSGGGCSGIGSCTVTMTANIVVRATFGDTFLSVLVNGNGTVTGPGIICPTQCSENYTGGTVVTLTATPATGAFFVGWSGACSGAVGPCVMTMDGVKSVTANFSVSAVTLTVAIPRSTVIKASHIAQLRSAIDTVRSRNGLPGFGWTDPTLMPGVTVVKGVHFVELRTALTQVYQATGKPVPTFTDPNINPMVTIAMATHLNELRNAVLALER